ncbi:MAG: hypothetical protein CVU69_05680 [Deltaproteobacteria bacterium HGW-Deltaproteobacteria-4]|nr:MAG: hypothetical protein CVU69_05680 [Deltaproteobacteria bacterium HGW-Deltaproteobacteria-4]
MRKHGRLFIVALLLLLAPSLASAWILQYQGQGSSSDGSATIYFQDATTNVVLDTANAATYVKALKGGQSVVSLSGPAKATVVLATNISATVTIDGTPSVQTVSSAEYPLPETTVKMIAAWGQAASAKGNVSIVKTTGGSTLVQYGTVSTMTGYNGLAFGSTVNVKASPRSDYQVTGITVSKLAAGETVPVVTNPAFSTVGAGVPVTVTGVVVDTASVSVSASYALVANAKAFLSAPLKAVVGQTVTLSAVGSTSNDPSVTYQFKVGGVEAQNTTVKTYTFTPTAPSTGLAIELNILDGTTPLATKTATVQVVTAGELSQNLCLGCHSGSTPTVVAQVNASSHAAVSCADCHSTAPHNTLTDQPRMVDAAAVMTGGCAECHTTKSDAQLKVNPFNSEISERFVTSRHAVQSARNAYCSACHSHEGFVARIGNDKITTNAELATSYTAANIDVYALPVGSSTIAGVNRKQCSTCHSEHDFGLRGAGDEVATGLLPSNGATFAVDTTRTVYSAEFNLCTACHMVDLTATFVPEEGYGGRGMFTYELSEKYSSANLMPAGATTFDLTKAPFYHDGVSGSGRTFVDTHFSGTIMQHLTKFDGSTTDIELVGYNINAGSANACTICHDPHTAGKMLDVGAGTTVAVDDNNNKAISFAQGLGDFHTDYLADPFSRVQTGCTPCHTGSAFPRLANGATVAELGSAPWSVIGCRSCHDVAQPNAAPGANNAAAFEAVREFPAGYEYKFNNTNAAVVTAAELGNSAICFECHKGRTAGVLPATDPAAGTTNYAISYLHYAPSMAILFGNDSKMALTYPNKTYAGRMTHFDGTTKFNCTDCHNVHTGKDVMYDSTSCNTCHNAGSANLSKDALAHRTELFSIQLLDTIMAAMVAADGQVGLNATCQTKITALKGTYPNVNFATANEELMSYIAERQAYFPSRAIAHAVATWKIFTYEDGPEHGLTHGHGGSWAHNSKFARQLMYDAIESLNPAAVAGLTRP